VVELTLLVDGMLTNAKSEIKCIFPVGAQFYFEPSRPVDELLHDMRVIKHLGLNTLRFQEHWCIDESVEGKITLDKIEFLIEEAERLGLYVYFVVTLEQAPAWLYKKYPDCCMVYSTGERHYDPTQYRLPYDGKPGPCWDHPGARRAAMNFLSKLVQRLSRYDNIIEWNINQEIGIWPLHKEMVIPSATLGFCYCKYTLARFREWLRKKYGSLEELNRAWRTGYGDWEEVEPPRLYRRVPSYIDWRYFMYDIYIPSQLRWKVSTVKANDPKKRPVSAHVGGIQPGRGYDWRWAKEVDIYGSSCYPTGTFHEWDAGYPPPGMPVSRERCILEEVLTIALRYDYIRCAAGPNRKIAAAEFQGGPKGGWDRVPTSEDIRRWVLTALSSGIQELLFWNIRSEIFWTEAYGFGLLDFRRDSTPRAEEAGRLSRALNEYPELFNEGTVPRAEVAILINEDLWHFMQARGFYERDLDKHLSYTIRGIYKMLWDSGIWVDFIESYETDINQLSKYKAIILPFPLAVDDEVFKLLRDYVASGGTLISEACPGRHDRFGFARSGSISPIAEELFSVEHYQVRRIHEPQIPPKWTPRELSYGRILPFKSLRGIGQFEGYQISPSFCVEIYKVKESTPILLYGDSVVGVVNKFGKGLAYLIGTLLGHAYTAFDDSNNQIFLLKILENANVMPEKCGGLNRRRRISKDLQAWFIFNMTSETVTEIVDLGEYTLVGELLQRDLSVDSNKLRIKVYPFDILCPILSTG